MLDEVYKVKNPIPSQHGLRKYPMIMQSISSFITGVIFLYYAYKVETDVKCFSNGEGLPSPFKVTEDWTDVSKAFYVVLRGYGIICLLDFFFELLRASEILRKLQPLIVLLTFLNLMVGFGFFLAIHIVRFRPSGSLCSDYKIYLLERGKLMKYYVIALWSVIGFFIISMIMLIKYLRHKNNLVN